MKSFQAFQSLHISVKHIFTLPVQYSRWIKPQDFREISPSVQPKYLLNELYYDHSLESINGGIPKIMAEIHQNIDQSYSKNVICHLMYNMAKRGVDSNQILVAFASQIDGFKGCLNPTLAFGGLYGSLMLDNSTDYLIEFFTEEVQKNAQNIRHFQWIEIVEALSKNTKWTPKHKNQYFKAYLRQNIISNWKKCNKSIKYTINLLEYMTSFECFDPEITKNICKALLELKINGLEKNVKVFQLVQALKEYMSVKAPDQMEEINQLYDKCVKNLSSKEDYKWRFNVEKGEWISYEELKKRALTHTEPMDILKGPYTLKDFEKIENLNTSEEAKLQSMETEIDTIVTSHFWQIQKDKFQSVIEEGDDNDETEAMGDGNANNEEEKGDESEEEESEDNDEEEDVEVQIRKKQEEVAAKKLKRKMENKKMKGKRKAKQKLQFENMDYLMDSYKKEKNDPDHSDDDFY